MPDDGHSSESKCRLSSISPWAPSEQSADEAGRGAGTVNGMLTTIDGAGRLVIPKTIRDRLGLRGGEQVEVEEREGEIRVTRPRPGARLVPTKHGLLTASPDSGLPGLGPEQVREILERSRR